MAWAMRTTIIMPQATAPAMAISNGNKLWEPGSDIKPDAMFTMASVMGSRQAAAAMRQAPCQRRIQRMGNQFLRVARQDTADGEVAEIANVGLEKRRRHHPALAHESRNVTARLNTGLPGFESRRSATK